MGESESPPIGDASAYLLAYDATAVLLTVIASAF
jgi:hypothetical protein